MTRASVSPQQEDFVVLLDDVPHPAAYAAEPFLVSSGQRVILAYPIAESDFERFGPFDSDEDPFCTVLFPNAAFYRLGPPGNGELEIHPLAVQGLLGYSVHEVMNSSLAAEIPAAGEPAVGDPAAAATNSTSAAHRHFVVTFNESTFECVASDYTVVGVYGAGEIASREAFALVR